MQSTRDGQTLTGRLKSRSESRPRRQTATLCLAPRMAAGGGGSLNRDCWFLGAAGRPAAGLPLPPNLESSALLLLLGGLLPSAPTGGVPLRTTANGTRKQLDKHASVALLARQQLNISQSRLDRTALDRLCRSSNAATLSGLW